MDEIAELEREITLFNSKQLIKTLKLFKKNRFNWFSWANNIIMIQKKISKQLGDGKLLSQLTKKKVVYNFRQNDLNNGGQGAPLTPIFHNVLANKINKKIILDFPINILNIGGIANITSTVDEKDLWNKKKLYAYDIGPGNCLIDEWIRKNSKKNYDDKWDNCKIWKNR